MWGEGSCKKSVCWQAQAGSYGGWWQLLDVGGSGAAVDALLAAEAGSRQALPPGPHALLLLLALEAQQAGAGRRSLS